MNGFIGPLLRIQARRLERERSSQQNRSSSLVKLSIIIATHARAAALGRLLDSLVPQLRGERHELFIAENGTPSPTPLAARIPVIHLNEPQPGKCRVQNLAIAAAQGELIACLDDDLIVGANYVIEVEDFFDSNPQYAAM